MRAALLSLLALLPLTAAALDDEVKAWFERAARAAEELNYEVVMVFDRDERLQTLHVVHGYHAGQVRERIESLDGRPREVVRLGDRVACNVGSGVHVLVGRGHQRQGVHVAVGADPEALSAWYAFALGPEDRVAGRRCRVLRIEPRDAYRYGYRLCLDAEVGLPLRSEIVDHEGRVLERMVVTRLELHPEPPPAEQFAARWASVEGSGRSAAADSGPAAEPGVWHVGRLPPGYEIVERSRYPLAGGAVPVDHIVVSDGLAAVSVFVRPQAEGLFQGLKYAGAMHVLGLPRPPYHITVMGEVPPVVVRMIGESVERVDRDD
jgi:sigma-E factor negative regulatory protein RseB